NPEQRKAPIRDQATQSVDSLCDELAAGFGDDPVRRLRAVQHQASFRSEARQVTFRTPDRKRWRWDNCARVIVPRAVMRVHPPDYRTRAQNARSGAAPLVQQASRKAPRALEQIGSSARVTQCLATRRPADW